MDDPRPRRVQLRRTKGWRMPENTVSVARPGKWGNPHCISNVGVQPFGDEDDDGVPTDVGPWLCHNAGPRDLAGWYFPTKREAAEKAVAMYRWRMEADTPAQSRIKARDDLAELRGKNLACWCPLDQPCHADVLLELANPHPSKSAG